MALIDQPERAQRRARTIASDILAYYESKVLRGIAEDTLFEELHEEIEKGREHYLNNVVPEITEKTNYFDRAIVDVILYGRGYISSKIW